MELVPGVAGQVERHVEGGLLARPDPSKFKAKFFGEEATECLAEGRSSGVAGVVSFDPAADCLVAQGSAVGRWPFRADPGVEQDEVAPGLAAGDIHRDG